ncbi:hypothetical protein SEA_FORREST_257 [Streptomyces phage Forrest]|nr:hypothetical protein SEA_FORREST_257 [Streptomyces phage Forrest]QZE11590.1 hypothetical protein SEA_JADA_258 [Streptomyces phage Jada]
MSEKLGSQTEANEIFEFALRHRTWQKQENNNYYARRAFEYYAEEMAAWEDEQKRIAAGEYVYWPMRKPRSLEVHYPYGPNLPEPELMEGWRYLASGVSRSAYLAPSGVVYKVMKTPGATYQGNKEEHETAERARRSGSVKGAYIPRTTLWEVPGCYVIAIEFMDGIREDKHWEMNCWGGKCYCYFPGAPRCASRIRDELQYKLGLTDLHSHNVLWVPSQRAWAVVDLGNG